MSEGVLSEFRIMMYNMNNIDKQAEREAKALRQQGQYNSQQYRRQNSKRNYNKTIFNKLFKD
jgi:hypothetical protein